MRLGNMESREFSSYKCDPGAALDMAPLNSRIDLTSSSSRKFPPVPSSIDFTHNWRLSVSIGNHQPRANLDRTGLGPTSIMILPTWPSPDTYLLSTRDAATNASSNKTGEASC